MILKGIAVATIALVGIIGSSQDSRTDLVPSFQTPAARDACDHYAAAVSGAADAYWDAVRGASRRYSDALGDALKGAMAAGNADETVQIRNVMMALAAQIQAHPEVAMMPQEGPKGTPTQVTWKAGEGPKRLIRVSEGICFLSGIGGKMFGDGESIQVVAREGFWYLECKSGQPTLWATATCVRFNR